MQSTDGNGNERRVKVRRAFAVRTARKRLHSPKLFRRWRDLRYCYDGSCGIKKTHEKVTFGKAVLKVGSSWWDAAALYATPARPTTARSSRPAAGIRVSADLPHVA